MSRKTKKKRRAVVARPEATRRPARVKTAAALAACALMGAAFAATRYAPVRGALGLAPLAQPAPQSQPPLQLAKEYVYAGGRLVATEEPAPSATPTPPPAGPAPTNVVATLQSVSGASASVAVSWSAPTGQVASYVVERANLAADFRTIGQPVIAPATSFIDADATEGTAYLYRVRAVFAGGGSSGPSDADLATAVVFTDDPLAAGVTPVRAVQLTELRRAVIAVRAVADLGAPAWTDPSPAGTKPRVAHLQELRAGLDEALSSLGRPVEPYTDPDPTPGAVKMKKVHFEELRQRLK